MPPPEAATDAAQGVVRPIFVVAPPASGAQLVTSALGLAADIWVSAQRAPDVVDGVPSLHPSAHDWASARLTAADAADGVRESLAAALAARVHDHAGNAPEGSVALTIADTSEAHGLRVPFLAAAFPDARFVYVYREPRAAVAVAAEAWRSGGYVSYPQLPDWPEPAWSFALVDGWRELAGRSVEEIAARQWVEVTTTLLSDLEALPPSRWAVVGFDQLRAQPQRTLSRLGRFLDVTWRTELRGDPAVSATALPPPGQERWWEREDVQDVLPLIDEAASQARDLFGVDVVPARRPLPRQPVRVRTQITSAADDSLRTALAETQSSLLVSTYRSGRLIAVRSSEERIDTQSRVMPTPTGIAVRPGGFAVASRRRVTTYRNHPALATQLAASVGADACYLPINGHSTGNIGIQEMSYVDGELWLVSARYSCLATLDDDHSFVPRWQPSFVTALTPDDRCHLTGFAVVDGRPAFATALGASDEPDGWRADAVAGGVVVDIVTGDVVAGGLSFPHSPRWHDGRLWVLQAGNGTLGVVDVEGASVQPVVTLPGLVRGLAFAGRYAFVGVSPVGGDGASAPARDGCGVWVVDTESGAALGSLRFDRLVRSVFDVQVLSGIRRPEIPPGDSPIADEAIMLPGDLDEPAAEPAEPTGSG